MMIMFVLPFDVFKLQAFHFIALNQTIVIHETSIEIA